MPGIHQSVVARFLVMFLAVFAIASATVMELGSRQRIADATGELGARIGTLAAAVAASLPVGTQLGDTASFRRSLAPLVADAAVQCVDILENNETLAALSHPRRLGCDVMNPESVVTIALPRSDAFLLRVGFSAAEIRQMRIDMRFDILAVMALGALISAVAATVAFRRTVGQPVEQIIRAISTYMETGENTRVGVSSRDEIGMLAATFDDMQTRLQDERRKTLAALEQVQGLYNCTPALLFTMDGSGTVLTASEHWRAETGYDQDEAIGRRLDTLLSPDSRVRFRASILADLLAGEAVHETPLQIWRKDGSEIDVLLSAVREPASDSAADAHFVCVMADVSLLRSAERDLKALAITDALTGLPNRLGLNQALETLRGHGGSTAAAAPYAILFIDLDNFKPINDSFGHPVGDRVLLECANRLRDTAGPGATLARIGGDEFAVIVHGDDHATAASELADRIVEIVSRPVLLNGEAAHLGASIGIALANEHRTPEEVLRLADQAMYEAKSAGKSRYVVFDDGTPHPVNARNHQVKVINDGLANGWFEMYFQPIMDLRTLRPLAVEALLRLKREGAGFNGVEEIIRIAEESGQMVQLGRWVLASSIALFRDLEAQCGCRDLSLNVNISSQQLTESFVHEVKKCLRANPDLVGRLVLEITETAAIRRFDVVETLLADMRQAGARIAIDDFGTGYSSLSYIARLPIDAIKLDRTFVAEIAGDGSDGQPLGKNAALIRSMGVLSRELGLELVAEGLESPDDISAMHALDVPRGQGYVFTPPLPAEAAARWLRHATGRKAETTGKSGRKAAGR